MDKKDLKAWQNYFQQLRINCALLTCRWLCQDNCKNTCNCCNDAANRRKPHQKRGKSFLTPNRLVPTFAAEDTPSGGYIEAIVALIKHAIFHKEGEHFIFITYNSVRDDG